VHNKGLVKTINFSNPKYIGDPINAVRIFNEKEVDELMVIDIDATVHQREPDYQMINNLAKECRMPLCYGGGIKTTYHAQKIFGLGVEKIALSSGVVNNPQIVTEIAKRVGNQSMIVVLDIKKIGFSSRYEILTHNASVKTGLNPFDFAKKMQDLGAGELIINSIDQDGEMKGYDLTLTDNIRKEITIPMTILGGAGTLDDIGALIQRYGIIGAAAGSLFVFKGKYRAVLINYPNKKEKEELINKYFYFKQ